MALGLRTLLEGAQIELRSTVKKFHDYLNSHSRRRDDFDLEYPDLFQQYPFHGLGQPDYFYPQIYANGEMHYVDWNSVKHSLGFLSRDYLVANILLVVKALFACLNSDKLLLNFNTIIKQASAEKQGDQDLALNNRAPTTAGSHKLEDYRPIIYKFWLEIIGGGEIKQLRYYLTNLLTYNVTPFIMYWMLEAGKTDEVLELAQNISQLPSFISVSQLGGGWGAGNHLTPLAPPSWHQ
ncbi:hypothetical protein H4R35_005439 [Dimargaris xerosporica]|nr:hypothetical protein H4R35_005439 [Dimargaris xerosporica]